MQSAFRERGGVLIAGRYRLHEQLGADRPHVWRATDELHGRIVAVKRVALFGLPAASVRDRILREAGAAAAVPHRNVVTTFAVVMEGGELWVIQEYVAARTLAGILADRGPLPAHEVAAIGAQVASALATAHAAGVVHRNVNPENILVAWPVVKLDDFGIASPTARGGPLPVVAPEILRGGVADWRSDIHALGGALHAAVRGRPPHASQAGPLAWPLTCLTAGDPAVRPTAMQAETMLRDVATRAVEPAPAKSGHRRLALGLALGLAAAAIVGVAAVAAPGPVDEIGRSAAPAAAPTTSTPTPPTPRAAPVIGDPRMADPCALVDAPALGRHGPTDVEPYLGSMASCWAYVTVRPDTEVAVSVELVPASYVPEQPGGVREQRGPLTLVRYTFDGSYCSRRIHLPDSSVALVTAESAPDVDPSTVCAVADTGTAAAADRLLAVGVTDRPTRIDATVLGGQNACQLLTAADLQAVSGAVTTPIPGLAGWSCRWGQWTDPNVTLTFWRRDGDLGKDETPIDIAGRPSTSYRSPTDGGCHITFPQQRFDGYTEAVSVYVYEPRVGADTCGAAAAIATAVAAKLPAPS